jgi:hypothetical protein
VSGLWPVPEGGVELTHIAARLPDELRSFDGWHYPNGLRDYMAALSAVVVDGQRVTPVMNAAGLSAADWFREMLTTRHSQGKSPSSAEKT